MYSTHTVHHGARKLCRACCHSGLNGVCHSTSLGAHDMVLGVVFGY